MAMRFVTMGVYGYTETTFIEALRQASIDVFIDTRRKRGVRGSQYAFANSKRLQETLKELSIPYVHRLDLAPTKDMIHAQDQADRDENIRRRDRGELTPDFKRAYQHHCLDTFDSSEFVATLGENIESILVFCVERTPDACHRSLLNERLCSDLGGTVEHLVPEDASWPSISCPEHVTHGSGDKQGPSMEMVGSHSPTARWRPAMPGYPRCGLDNARTYRAATGA